jgi:hypothetical protein
LYFRGEGQSNRQPKDSPGEHRGLQFAAVSNGDAEQFVQNVGQFAGRRQIALLHAAGQMVHREASAAKRQPAVRQSAGKYQARPERRGGMGRHEIVGDLVIGLDLLGQVETIERTPSRDVRLDLEEAAGLDDPEIFVRGDL